MTINSKDFGGFKSPWILPATSNLIYPFGHMFLNEQERGQFSPPVVSGLRQSRGDLAEYGEGQSVMGDTIYRPKKP